MVDDSQGDDFEIIPLRQIQELREEIARLKESPLPPARKLEVSMEELSTKLDKLITIFEEASHDIRVKEGGLSFSDQFKHIGDKMDKILDQNKEIAQGIVTVADMLAEQKKEAPVQDNFNQFGRPPAGRSMGPPPLFPQGGMVPPPPLPPRRK